MLSSAPSASQHNMPENEQYKEFTPIYSMEKQKTQVFSTNFLPLCPWQSLANEPVTLD